MSTVQNQSVLSKIVDADEFDEVEVTAQITVPPDGGWGWVVVIASFIIGFTIDSVLFTFGTLLGNISKDLKMAESLIALVNSTTVASYYCMGPVVSALINRFGFRLCAMTGAVISAASCLFTYLCGDYTALLIFYGIFNGFGLSLTNMSATLIVGFYFQKWRSLAFTFAVTGCSFGIIIGSQVYSHLTEAAGWTTTILLQSSMLAFLYFISMVFRPVLSMTVVQTTETNDTTKTLAYLPSVSRTTTKSFTQAAPSHLSRTAVSKIEVQRLFDAIPNVNFPTAAEMINESTILPTTEVSKADQSVPGPSISNKSRLTLVPNNTDHHQKEMQRLKSTIAMSQATIKDRVIDESDEDSLPVDISVAKTEEVVDSEQPGVLRSVFHWEEHVDEARPLYRDDVFYDASVKALPIAKDVTDNALEYQLKVSRAAATSDLQERKGLCTTAFRRVLATMLDPKLLRRRSFQTICLSMFMIYTGYLIPMVYVSHRGETMGIAEEYCSLFLSVIGFSGIFGRLTQGIIAMKVHPLNITISANSIAGIGTMLSGLGKTAVLQFVYSFLYGFTTAGGATIRSLILVRLYGLENLTNCTGIVVLFQGFGCLISTPLAGILRDFFGYNTAFIFAGSCLTIGGLLAIPVASLIKKENTQSTLKRPRTKSVVNE